MKTKLTFSISVVSERSSRRSGELLAWLMLVCVIGLCHSPSFAQEALILVGSGSSVPAPLYNKWALEYNKRNPGIQMKYVPMGTGEGIKQISHGSGDFGAGEVKLTAAERKEGQLIELPTVLIGIVPIYNLPGVHTELRFSGELLAEIFLGQVKTWNASEIAKLNPDASLPSLPIKVFYRSGGKGSNYVFSEFLSKTSSKFRTQIGTSPSPNWPVGTPAERSSDMADKVKSQKGSIGYVEAQYAVKANIPRGMVQNLAGKYVEASPETIKAACHGVEAPAWDKFSPSLTNASGANAFPITSFTWLYLRTTSSDPRRSAAMADLLNWMFTDGQRLAAEDGYAELPPPLLAKVKSNASLLH
ncbi:MAG: phosphate ABC transporter substrate-binding protein PstS [Candidatus Sulfotelmatobacter sp.]